MGICVERSLAMVAGPLGILKAGRAYVPFGPELPYGRTVGVPAARRTDAGAADTGAPAGPAPRALIAPGGVAGGRARSLAEGRPNTTRAAASGRRTWPTSSIPPALPEGPRASFWSTIAPSISSSWACAAITPQEESASVGPGTSICFDLSVFELPCPLRRGGRVLLGSLLPDVLHLPERLQRGEGTLLNTVPSAMVELVLAGRVPTGVRTVNLAEGTVVLGSGGGDLPDRHN